MNYAMKSLVLAAVAGFSMAVPSSAVLAQNFDFGRDIAAPFLQGLMEGASNQNNSGRNSGGGMRYKYEAPSQSGSGWNNWRNDSGSGWNNWNNNSGGGWNNNYVQPQPNYTPQYYSQPQTVARPAVVEAPAPPAPVAVKKEIVAVTPKANAINLQGRSITAAEIQSGKNLFGSQVQGMVSDLEQELRGSGVDQAALIAELSSKQVPSETQLQILQAVKNGDAAQTQILWTSAAKDVNRASELYKKVATQQLVKDLRDRADSLTVSAGDIREARSALSKLDLDASKRRSVESILGVMDDTLKILGAVSTAVPGMGTDTTRLPAGSVPIIMNPKLPTGHAVSLGNGYVMIGTGGVGAFELTNGSVAQSMGLPVAPGSPVAANDTTMTLDGVVLINPSNTGTTVHYKLKDTDYTMDPGFTQALAGDSWLVDFHRGGSFGRKSYKVSSGAYAFTPTNQGWELYSKTFEVMVDNSENPHEFNYAVQNEHATVGPRQTETHTSKYPIYIRFDRGNGSSIKQVKVQEGTVKVAMNPSDGLWDLYSPESTSESTGSGSFIPAF